MPTGLQRNADFFWRSNFGVNTSAFVDLESLESARLVCKRRSKNPSLKRPVGPVAPE
jgi:hypothetical protein